MTVATKRNYKITIILDTRGREESIDELIELVKNEIASLGVDINGVEDLGRRDFARQPDIRITAGNFVQYLVDGPPETHARVNEHFHLNPLIHRILIQSV